MRKIQKQEAVLTPDPFDVVSIIIAALILWQFFQSSDYYLVIIAIGVTMSLFAPRFIGILNSILGIMVIIMVENGFFSLEGLDSTGSLLIFGTYISYNILGTALFAVAFITLFIGDWFWYGKKSSFIRILNGIVSFCCIIGAGYFFGAFSDMFLLSSYLLTSVIAVNSIGIIGIFLSLKLKSKSFLLKGV